MATIIHEVPASRARASRKHIYFLRRSFFDHSILFLVQSQRYTFKHKPVFSCPLRRNIVLIRIGIMALRICVLLALIFGILLWANAIPNWGVMAHMTIGLLAVISLWLLAIGIGTASKGRSLGLAIGAFVLGLLLPIIGLGQLNWLALGNAHIVIQIIHLLLGLGAIGLGETIAARYRRQNKLA
jgi:hypothetical protein